MYSFVQNSFPGSNDTNYQTELISYVFFFFFFFQVYEAVIEDKGKNFIFMRLSKACVEELGLSCDQEFNAQVSFFLLDCLCSLLKSKNSLLIYNDDLLCRHSSKPTIKYFRWFVFVLLMQFYQP